MTTRILVTSFSRFTKSQVRVADVSVTPVMSRPSNIGLGPTVRPSAPRRRRTMTARALTRVDACLAQIGDGVASVRQVDGHGHDLTARGLGPAHDLGGHVEAVGRVELIPQRVAADLDHVLDRRATPAWTGSAGDCRPARPAPPPVRLRDGTPAGCPPGTTQSARRRSGRKASSTCRCGSRPRSGGRAAGIARIRRDWRAASPRRRCRWPCSPSALVAAPCGPGPRSRRRPGRRRRSSTPRPGQTGCLRASRACAIAGIPIHSGLAARNFRSSRRSDMTPRSRRRRRASDPTPPSAIVLRRPAPGRPPTSWSPRPSASG